MLHFLALQHLLIFIISLCRFLSYFSTKVKNKPLNQLFLTMNLLNNIFKSSNKKIKVFGERNSGTIYLEKLLRKNFKVQVLDYYTLGWKHRLAPSETEISSQDSSIIYLILVKNPYSWLRSMYRKPYHQEELKRLDFNEFIEFPYGDYANPVIMWNTKYASYLNLENYVENIAFLKYEDLLKFPEKTLNDIKNRFDLTPSMYWFSDIQNQLTNNHGELKKKFHKNYYLQEKWKSEYSPELFNLVNKHLDKNLMTTFGYPVIEHQKELTGFR